MALQRTDTTVVTGETVSADYDDIIGFQVDLLTKSVSIAVGSGNLEDGKFNVEVIKRHIIQDKVETTSYKEETLQIVNNQITLSDEPKDNVAIFFLHSPVKNYNIDGNILTFNDEEEISGLTEIKVGYSVTIAADPVFSTMAAQMADGDKSIYQNLKQLLWNKLIELGHVSGTII